ncbi:hypothetical protein CYMTET_42241 [Cymbomonas tetramitiformis]|uniref:Uncharacterized protein n=1 Tax=Cymbomonas tetramitiformis TaxID=36881 RepID=A0AAE0F1Q2_9CHLO|nr:hypothetical protein CYMTET_42241 [Cymbomonas tetramitiformis]
MLWGAGVYLKFAGKDGRTPAHEAAFAGHVEVLRILQGAGLYGAFHHKGLATWEVVGLVVKPATGGFHRCRYVELPEMASEVGRATVFVSHTWGARLEDEVVAIAHADLDFESLVRDTDALLLMCTLSCVWRLKDLAAAQHNHKPVALLDGGADPEVCRDEGLTPVRFATELLRQKAAAEPTTTVTGIADLLRWVDEAPYGKTQCLRTVLSCKTGKRNWLLPVEGWGATADLEDFFVTNVPADAETLRPAGDEVGGATPVERAPGATGETHRSNNFCVRVSAAGELWYHCLAGTCLGRRRLQPPRAVDEDAELAGAPAVAQQERAGKWRQINADRSKPDVAETGSHAERDAVSSGAVGQATLMSAADDSPPPGQPAAGRAGVTGLEQQRTTGKRRRNPPGGDVLVAGEDERGVDVQRMLGGDTGERRAAGRDVDELNVTKGQASGPSVDEQRPAGGGVDELNTAERHAAGARTGERRPADGGVDELDTAGQHAAGARTGGRRLADGDMGEQRLAEGGVDELDTTGRLAAGVKVDEQRPAGEGVNELDVTGRHAAGARADELRPTGGGVNEVDMASYQPRGGKRQKRQRLLKTERKRRKRDKVETGHTSAAATIATPPPSLDPQ